MQLKRRKKDLQDERKVENLKVIKVECMTYHNSVELSAKVDGVNMNYRVDIEFKNLKLYVSKIGLKTSRQRDMRFPSNNDNHAYRCMSTEERLEADRKLYASQIPPVILNTALSAFYSHIEMEKWYPLTL